jgi:hypothetical protein
MTATSIEEEILGFVRKLPLESQRRVRDFAQALVMTERPRGGSPQALLEWLHSWDPEDAADVAQAMREEREREKARYHAG